MTKITHNSQHRLFNVLLLPFYTKPCKFCYKNVHTLPFKNLVHGSPGSCVNERRMGASFCLFKMCPDPIQGGGGGGDGSSVEA